MNASSSFKSYDLSKVSHEQNMRKLVFTSVVLCIYGCTTPTSKEGNNTIKHKGNTTRIEIVAKMPKGHFLENIVADDSGNLFVTDYIGREILKYHPADGLRSVIELEAHPAGIALIPGGLLVVGQGKSILSSSVAPKTNHIFEISLDGKLLEDYPAPRALFLNGVTPLSRSEYLITDALGSKVWKLNIEKNELTEWISSELLAPIEGKNIPAANGIKIHDDKVFISNSVRGLLLTVPVNEPSEENLNVFLEDTVIDDFVFSKNGTLYATTHGPLVLTISKNGVVSKLVDEGGLVAGGTTAAIVSENGQEQLYVIGDGGLFEGKELLPASIVKIPIEE